MPLCDVIEVRDQDLGEVVALLVEEINADAGFLIAACDRLDAMMAKSPPSDPSVAPGVAAVRRLAERVAEAFDSLEAEIPDS